MTKLGLRPYRGGDDPAPGSVPVSVVVLTRDEEVNIRRCLASVAWADQVVVVDSGSTDDTVPIAGSLGAEVVRNPWPGFSAQREFALRLPSVRHDWVYFVDADEWVSPQLAAEIAAQLRAPACSGFAQRFRLVFQGTWIRHCGWYRGSWIVRLVDRRFTKYDGTWMARAHVNGPTGRLRSDLVDEDCKGLAAWLHKHVRYAQLEAERRDTPASLSQRLHALRTREDTRPMIRAVLKDVIFPSVPAKPAAIFAYMYLVRLGVLDGLAGLRFCFFHAWFEATVKALHADRQTMTYGASQPRAQEALVTASELKLRVSRIVAGDRAGRVIGGLTGKRIRHQGLWFDTRSSDFSPTVRAQMFWGGYEGAETRMIRSVLRGSSTVVELGSSLGVTAAHIAAVMAAGGHLVCVEANPTLLPGLRERMARHAAGLRVDLVHAAVTDHCGTAALTLAAETVGSRLDAAPRQDEYTVDVPALTLREIVSRMGLAEFDLVSDIEGSEVAFLLQDPAALKGCRRAVIELHATTMRDCAASVSDLVDAAVAAGFRVTARHGPVVALVRA
jgi:FkbM family methyltransferase